MHQQCVSFVDSDRAIHDDVIFIIDMAQIEQTITQGAYTLVAGGAT
jgi:hypothetical protein